MRRTLSLLLPLSLPFLLLNCEDPIDVESGFTTPQLVVEAWLTNESENQTISLTLTQDFYDNRLPTGLEDATVIVCRTDDQACFPFVHQDSGRYVWTPQPGEVLGEIGDEFALAIERGDDRYVSLTSMNRVPAIDSISFQFEEEALGLDEGLYAQLYARDFPGQGDTYLIRTTWNDTLNQRPQELNLVYDATFDAGSDADGFTFIFPIRFRINRLDDDGSPVPLETGDNVKVDIWSISLPAFAFLSIAAEQIQNGDSGIFGVPVANSPGNIVKIDSEERVLGIFNVAAVSSAERTLTD